MNAMTIYVDAFSAILDVEKTGEAESWSEVHKLLLSLKDAISCFICKKLLSNPMKSPSLCGHFVCSVCIEHMASMCEQCENEKDNFIPNQQMDTLIQCYRKMCDYTINSKAYRNFSMNGNKPIKIDNFSNSNNDSNAENVNGTNNSAAALVENDTDENISIQLKLHSASCESDSDDFLNPSQKYKKIISTPSKNDKNTVSVNGKIISIKEEPVDKGKMTSASNRQAKAKFTGCKCGLATAVPGKLTCCGQRCACYVSGKACLSCKCRGCRNPQNRKLETQAPPLAANHYLISMSKSNNSQHSDGDSSDVDVDN